MNIEERASAGCRMESSRTVQLRTGSDESI